MPRWLRSMFGSDYYDDRYRLKRRIIYKDRDYDDHHRRRGSFYRDRDYEDRPRRRSSFYRDGAYYGSTAGRVVTSTSQVCAACGKLRSPSWSSRHPLRHGEVPRGGLCRKCAAKSTSSERSAYSRRPSEAHHRPCSRHHHARVTDDLYGSFESVSPPPSRRRYRSDSLGYLRPSSVTSIPSTDDSVRVYRRVYVDRPVRRGVLKTPATCSVYSDEIVESVEPPKKPLRPTRTRSGSSVHFVDDLGSPPYRHRPRSLSRRRSTEEIIVSTPRRRSRSRRPIYYDGPADGESGRARRERVNVGGSDSKVKGREEDPASAASQTSPKAVQGENAGSSQAEADSIVRERNSSPASTISASTSLESLPTRPHSPQNLDGTFERAPAQSNSTEFQDRKHQRRVVFEECSYEIDSQFPSPPLVNLEVPTLRMSRSPSPLQLPTESLYNLSSGRNVSFSHTETYRPPYFTDEGLHTMPCPTSYEPVFDSSTSFDAGNIIRSSDTPPTSVTSSEHKSVSSETVDIAADEIYYSDDLSYLLSTAHIAPGFEYMEKQEPQDEDTTNPSYESLPMPQRFSRDHIVLDSRPTSPGTVNLDGGSENAEESYRSYTDLRNLEPWAPSPHKRTRDVEEIKQPQRRKRARRAVLRDIFDEPKLEQKYHETADVEEIKQPQRRKRARQAVLYDIFDKPKLEQKYHETAIDYEAKGRAHMAEVLRKREEEKAKLDKSRHDGYA